MTSTVTVAPPRAETWAERLWAPVAVGDEDTAAAVVRAAHGAGLDAESVLLDVIGAVQRRVGAEWAANRLGVAQEHAATAVNEQCVGVLRHSAPPAVPAPGAGRIVVACVDGEWHGLPARLVAEVLRLRGWHVDHLGAQVPAPHLIGHLHRTGADAVALSGSLAPRLPVAHATLTACQAVGVPVLVGGAAFGHDGRYARLLGADAWAPDARAAADRLARGPLPPPPRDHVMSADLPHLADQEYTFVTRSRQELVRAVFHGLLDRYPPMRAYTALQREHTAEDLDHVVAHLATALYVDDADLFTGFLGWTASILAARGVPAASLLPALAVLAERLRDFPRALGLLAAGTEAVRGAESGGAHAVRAAEPLPGAGLIPGAEPISGADPLRDEASRDADEAPR
ncbi:cobalamin B12-binding domain-containing protein [Streptomyces sp. NRRL F-5630]|uniref:cobalamin B12-binding domain-containing protein n=1 Tax=Streptomyces sp. NRRL F-5630 TaxID=1463864 RepID=UPI003D7053AA